MREFSGEEINRLWEHAYYRASGAGNPLGGVLFFLAFLMLPIALFGFNSSLLLAWILISIPLIGFALHVRSILERSKKGKFPARLAIIRVLAFGPLALLVLWLAFILLQFGLVYLLNPNEDLVWPTIITSVVYAVTIPIAFMWGNEETLAISERKGIRRSGLNMFGGWMHTYYWAAVIFQAVVLNLLLSVDFSIRFVFFIGPYAGLMLFIFVMLNVNFLWTLMQVGLDKSPFQESLKEAKKEIKVMSTHSGPTRIPVRCEGCNAQGEIEVDDPEGNFFVICEACGTETAEVWCDDSGAGGHFVRNIHEHPFEYYCEMCKKTHRLPDDFYEKPVTLELIEEPRRKKK